MVDGLGRGGVLLNMGTSAVGIGMALFFLYFLLRVLCRKPWLGALAYLLAVVAIGFVGGSPAGAAFSLIHGTVAVFVLARFGLLSMVIAIVTSSVLPEFPMTSDFSVWYSGATMFAISMVLATAGWAFYTTRAGRAR
jgi:hypothetical protein